MKQKFSRRLMSARWSAEAPPAKWMNCSKNYFEVLMMSESNEKIRETVRQEYTKIAQGGSGCCGSSSTDKLAEGSGYMGEDLEVLPEGANMGLSCGNPTAIANLNAGQLVLDLGS